jgi:hypothetical protein
MNTLWIMMMLDTGREEGAEEAYGGNDGD